MNVKYILLLVISFNTALFTMEQQAPTILMVQPNNNKEENNNTSSNTELLLNKVIHSDNNANNHVIQLKMLWGCVALTALAVSAVLFAPYN